MSQDPQGESLGPQHRWVEIGVTALTAAFALVVISGSIEAGYNWAPDGPRAGFFPFYVALIILAASIVNFVQVRADPDHNRLFSEWAQLRQVASVVVPTALYVVAVPWIGIYFASMLLIAAFMAWFGRYSWSKVLPIAVGVPMAIFIVFERWFLVPLPKGPVEEWLGF